MDFEDIIAFFIAMLIISFVIGVISRIALSFMKDKDKSKPLHTAKVRIIEKVSQGLVEWYVVEFENGERKKLRNFDVNTVFIAVGDVGIMEYSGTTIQSFHSLNSEFSET